MERWEEAKEYLSSVLLPLRGHILERQSVRTCILSCRVLGIALDRAGFHAEAVPVEVSVLNAAAARQIGSTALQAIPGQQPFGVWIGAMERSLFPAVPSPGAYNPGDYPGHLVLVVEDRLLVDPSADQFHHENGINIATPLVLKLRDEEMPFARPGALVERAIPSLGVSLFYRSGVGVLPPWDAHPHWENRRAAEFIVNKVARR